MSKKIDELVDVIIKELIEEHYTKADRLQKVLEELIKVEVAAIRGRE